jgi:hypothetical protein
VRFRPYQIALLFFVHDPDQLRELFLGRLDPGRVGCLSRRLRSPRRIGQTKIDPTRLGRTQLALIDAAVSFVRACVRTLRVLALGFGFELRVVGLLRERRWRSLWFS